MQFTANYGILFRKKTASHKFFQKSVAIPNTRYAHFDIVAKVATVEIEGTDTGLRLDDVKKVFVANNNFSSTSAVGKRITAALDLLASAFPKKDSSLREPALIVQLVHNVGFVSSFLNREG